MARVIYLLISCLAAGLLYSPAAAQQSVWPAQLQAAEALPASPMALGPLKGRITVVAFFASWCPPCRDEFRHLNQVVSRTDDTRVVVVGVNVFEAWGGKRNPARMARFIAQTEPEFALVRGTPALRAAFGNIERIPSLIVFDAAGREVWRFVHARGSTRTHATIGDILGALKRPGYSAN